MRASRPHKTRRDQRPLGCSRLGGRFSLTFYAHFRRKCRCHKSLDEAGTFFLLPGALTVVRVSSLTDNGREKERNSLCIRHPCRPSPSTSHRSIACGGMVFRHPCSSSLSRCSESYPRLELSPQHRTEGIQTITPPKAPMLSTSSQPARRTRE